MVSTQWNVFLLLSQSVEELPYVPPPEQYEQDISFFGGRKQGDRSYMLEIIANEAKKVNVTTKVGKSK